MIKKISVLFALLCLWEFAARVSGVPIYILPPPFLILKSLWNNQTLLAKHALISSFEILVGLLVSVFLGLLSALLLDHFVRLNLILRPVLLTLQSVPSFVLMPLLLLWCGFGLIPKLIVICLSCYFPITICLLDGLKRSPSSFGDMATVMGAKPKQVLWRIRLPSSLPFLMSGIRLAAIHAPLTVLAADWLGASSGLGYLVMLSHGRLQIDLMFACVVCITAMTFALNKGVNMLEKKLVFWPSASH